MKAELIKIYNKHTTPLDSGDFGSGVQQWMSEQDFLDALHDYEVLKQSQEQKPTNKVTDEQIDDIIYNYILDTTLIDAKKPQEIGDALRVSEINQAFRKGLSLNAKPLILEEFIEELKQIEPNMSSIFTPSLKKDQI